MWFIVPKDTRDDRLHLPVGKELLVGRSEGHVTIDDRSVSRKHAVLMVKRSKCGGQTNFEVSLRDTSRFGCFVNGEKLVQAERHLVEGDIISFGIPTGIQFSLEHEPLIVCSSSISASVKSSLVKTLDSLGAELVSEWQPNCTLLVIAKVSITIKVISALLQGCCIVTPDFVFHLRDFHNGTRSSPPEPSSYQPAVLPDSQTLDNCDVDLMPREERQQLFRGDTFVFMTKKRYDRLARALELGGAHCKLWEHESDMKRDNGEVLVKEALIFYEETPNRWQRGVYSMLRKYRRRPIADAEIGYAVLACSKQEYCNVTKRCEMLSRHGINFSQLPSDVSQSFVEPNPTRHSRTSYSILDETPAEIGSRDRSPIRHSRTSHSILDETPAETSPRERMEEDNYQIKTEVMSEADLKPNVLVPQTPPVCATEEPADVTNVTTVACSLELKSEPLWSEESTALPLNDEATSSHQPSPSEVPRRKKVTERMEPPILEDLAPEDSEQSDTERTTAREEEESTSEISERTNKRGATEISERASKRGATEISERTNKRDAVEISDEETSGRDMAAETLTGRQRAAVDGEESRLSQRKRKEDAEETICVREEKRSKFEVWEKEVELPRNCTEVQFASLFRTTAPPARSVAHGDGPNFKKFRKVGQTSSQVARRPVALIVHDKPDVQEEDSELPSQRNKLDSQAATLFEEMRRVPPRTRR